MESPVIPTPGPAENSFHWLGNHPALDFANTLVADKNGPVDLLTDWESIQTWLQAGPLAGAAAHLKDLSIPESLREPSQATVRAFRNLFKDSLIGYSKTGDAPALAEAANSFLRGAPGSWQIDRKSGVWERTWLPQLTGSLAGVMGVLAQAVADFLCHTPHALVHKCANPACQIWFYDNSRNHRRQWCSMALCGNREKAAAHRARVRTRTDAE